MHLESEGEAPAVVADAAKCSVLNYHIPVTASEVTMPDCIWILRTVMASPLSALVALDDAFQTQLPPAVAALPTRSAALHA